MTGKRGGFHATWEAGLDDEGHILAYKAVLTADGGCSVDLSPAVVSRALCHVDNAYYLPNVHVVGQIARTNKTSHTAFRGFGAPAGMIVTEDLLGQAATKLGIQCPARARQAGLGHHSGEIRRVVQQAFL